MKPITLCRTPGWTVESKFEHVSLLTWWFQALWKEKKSQWVHLPQIQLKRLDWKDEKFSLSLCCLFTLKKIPYKTTNNSRFINLNKSKKQFHPVHERGSKCSSDLAPSPPRTKQIFEGRRCFGNSSNQSSCKYLGASSKSLWAIFPSKIFSSIIKMLSSCPEFASSFPTSWNFACSLTRAPHRSLWYETSASDEIQDEQRFELEIRSFGKVSFRISNVSPSSYCDASSQLFGPGLQKYVF